MVLRLNENLKAFADSVLYSYAQILFSNRRWFGALLMAATFARPSLGLLGLAGVVLSNTYAHLLKFDAARIRSGFYGFNGILFGAALGFYYDPSPFLLALFPILIFLTFLIAAVLENYFAVAFNLPGLSLPFVLSLFISVVFLRNYDEVVFAALPYGPAANAFEAYLHSLALIFFQPGKIAGVVIALGILLFSRVLFVLSLAGFAAGYFFLNWMLPQHAGELVILVGFNAILTAIALGGSLIIPSRKSLALAILAVMVVVIFTGFFIQVVRALHLPLLVLPFNAVVLTTLYSLKFRQASSDLVLLYFAPGSPEENYHHHHSQQARFAKFKYFMPDLPVSGEWTVSQGNNGDITHRELWQHAWDFVVTDEDGKTHRNGGLTLEDFHCYRLPVTAPLDGEVALVVDSIPNNRVGDINFAQNWGNTIILNHGEGLFSAMSHLEPGTARVARGAYVKRGEILALCGNSGRSPEPHLHFQFQATDKLGDRTLPYAFGFVLEDGGEGYRLKIAGNPAEKTRVQNVVEHRSVREALYFALGSTHEWDCRFGKNQRAREVWTVKADMNNTLYLESSAGATVAYVMNDRVLYLTNFQGSRRSALYHFYLSAAQVPMVFQNGLEWEDAVPLTKVYHSPLRYISDLWLALAPSYTARLKFRWDEDTGEGQDMTLESRLEIRGRGLLRGTGDTGRSRLNISNDGFISRFEYFRGDRRVLVARRREQSAPESSL